VSERDPIESDAERESDAASAEAARIGGRSGEEEMDEAERASAEHGGGEAEGFEQAEEQLEQRAAHGDEHGGPLRDRPDPEPSPDPASHGEADRVDSTETEADTQGTERDPDAADED
jgi:hypothetical protein